MLGSGGWQGIRHGLMACRLCSEYAQFMFNIRPFRLTLYGLLLVALGGLVFLWGVSLTDPDAVGYTEYVTQRADLAAQNRIDQASQNVEFFEVGRPVKYLGGFFALVGGLVLLASAGLFVTHAYILPKLKQTDEETQGEASQAAADDEHEDVEEDEDESDDEDELVDDEEDDQGGRQPELGQELLSQQPEKAEDVPRFIHTSRVRDDDALPEPVELEPERDRQADDARDAGDVDDAEGGRDASQDSGR